MNVLLEWKPWERFRWRRKILTFFAVVKSCAFEKTFLFSCKNLFFLPDKNDKVCCDKFVLQVAKIFWSRRLETIETAALYLDRNWSACSLKLHILERGSSTRNFISLKSHREAIKSLKRFPKTKRILIGLRTYRMKESWREIHSGTICEWWIWVEVIKEIKLKLF